MFSSCRPGSSKTWRTRRPGRRWSRDGLNRSSHNICVKYNYYVYMTSNICVQHSYYNNYVVRTKIVCAERLGFPNFRSIPRDFLSNLSQNSFEIFAQFFLNFCEIRKIRSKFSTFPAKSYFIRKNTIFLRWNENISIFIDENEVENVVKNTSKIKKNFERKWPNFVC